MFKLCKNILIKKMKKPIENNEKLKKSKSQILNNENYESLNEEEEEEEEEELDEYKKKEKEYIVQIEELSNELQIEKNITNSIQKDPVQEEIISKLKDELSEKQIKFNQLKNTNEKQKKAIEQLSKEINKTFLKTKNNNNNLNHISHRKYNSDFTKNKEEPINIILKIKEKQLNEALSQLEALRKKNEEMKLTLENSNNDYNQKIELIDLGKEKEEKISVLNKELKMLNKEMEDHNKCLNEQKECLNVLEQLKKEMKEEKKENMNLREKIKENEKKLHFLIFGDVEKIKKKNNNNENITYKNNNKKKYLPTLKSSRMNNTILSENFLNKLKESINDIEEYEILINKIKDLENGRSKLEKKHKNELNLIGEQINNLDIQYNFLDNKGKENDTENRILKCKINELKNEQKINQKKLIDSQKQLEFLINKNKEKDQEIKLLTMKLNSMKKIIKYGNVNEDDMEINEYINKLKKEKEDTFKNIISKEEQEVQANFDDNEEEDN